MDFSRIKIHRIIRGQFYGHTHWDQFKIYLEEWPNPDEGGPLKAINSMFIRGSGTPYPVLNPGYSIYHGNSDGYVAMDRDKDNRPCRCWIKSCALYTIWKTRECRGQKELAV